MSFTAVCVNKFFEQVESSTNCRADGTFLCNLHEIRCALENDTMGGVYPQVSVKNDLHMRIYRWCGCFMDEPPSVFEQSNDSRQTIFCVVNRGRAGDHCNKHGRPDDAKMKAGLMG